ncbi:MAG: hypothetical protein Q8937_13905 [Bacteroidota bacterium]|nr:hypothetical protein [Bacteroidota bacterium]
MKQISSLALGGLLALASLNGFSQTHTAATLPPGAIPVTAGGASMTAKINGKACTAHAMMPPDQAGEIVGFYDGDKYIGLPYKKRNMVAGKKINFSDENADLTTHDRVQVWGGRKGEMEITKVAGQWVEGKFFFTGYSYDNKQTIEVTNGFFRIQLK